nr:unnamed protein product [Haemonchus contortus]
MRARRPRRSLSESERKAKKEAYTGELVKDADQRYRERKGRVEDTTPESALGRLSDLIPLEESIDPRYPAQRIIISNFVRKGCRIKRWLYEDTYPIHSHRPTIGELVRSRPRNSISRKCLCGQQCMCSRRSERSASNKKNSTRQNCENERIRGELQRLDVLLKNLDDSSTN